MPWSRRPAVTVAGLLIGGSDTQRTVGRRFHLYDTISWQHGTHRTRFGGDWEYNRGGVLNWSNEPVSLVLFSPDQFVPTTRIRKRRKPCAYLFLPRSIIGMLFFSFRCRE